MLDLSTLNPAQREAVLTTEGPLLVLAGAGSGKTRVLTYRIAHLVQDLGVAPWSILAVTFTNKAAKEMRSRLGGILGADMRGMWINTFHSMCVRMLRADAPLLGYGKDFTIYDADDSKRLVKAIMEELGYDTKRYPDAGIRSRISAAKNELKMPGDMPAADPYSKCVAAVYKAMQTRLKRSNAMDFDYLLRNTLHLLRDYPDILGEYQRRFLYIMVDEYQDTNHIQYEIIKMLAAASRNLCVVGDDDQCIYQWRGADIRNILDFEKDFKEARVIKLEQNYRSCGNILSAAHSVIRNNKGRKAKKLWTEQEEGHKIVYTRCDNDKEEASYVARQIQLMEGPYRSFDDFAVLYRTNAQSRLFEDALRRQMIPYQVLSGFSFYERKETKDMISYMRLVVNPKDDMAFLRIINEPKRGIGPKSIEKLKVLAEVQGKSMMEVISDPEVAAGLPAKAGVSVMNMAQVIELCREERDNLRISDIYDLLLVRTGYLKSLEDQNTIEAEGRIENLMDFKSFIYDFEKEKEAQGEEATLEEFLEKVATDGDADKYQSESGKVTLMTLHSAKGLEFPVVFMPGMEDGLFPGHRAMDSEEKMEEERRLCYVGMTRAKERLFLTGAAYRVIYGQGDYARESTFLRELDPKVLDEAGDSVYVPNRRTVNSVGIDTGSLDGFAVPAYKPYDPLQRARKESKVNASGNDSDFNAGDAVAHGKFGRGIVLEADEKTVTVIFEEAGRKKLARGIAPLKKI